MERELRQKLNKKIKEAKALADKGDLEGAKKVTDEAKELKKEIEQKEAIAELENEMNDTIDMKPVDSTQEEGTKKAKMKAFIKAITGKELTDTETGLVEKVDENGGYLVPEDENNTINEFKRHYKSMKELVNVYETETLTGTFVYEDTSTITELTDVDELDEINEEQPKFKSKSYKVGTKAGIIPISNNLISDEKGKLFKYIGRWFAKKAVRTENKKIFEILKSVKTTLKSIASLKDLKSIINLDLDPMISEEAVIVTNQTGFNCLDQIEDKNGRGILEANATDQTKKMYKGLNIHVFSDAELKNVNGKAPVIVGNMEEAITFVERTGYEIASSSHAGFTKNATFVRCIERFDVIDTDNDAFVYALMDPKAMEKVDPEESKTPTTPTEQTDPNQPAG